MLTDTLMVNLLAATVVLISGIFWFTSFLKSRTKYDLVASIVSLIVLLGIVIMYVYREGIKEFFLNHGIGIGVQSAIIASITVLIWAILLYPGIKKNLSNRKAK